MRCKTWSDIIGHASLLNWITARVENDNVPNVIILHGSAGIGKTSIAKLLAVHTVYRHSTMEHINNAINIVIEQNKDTPSIKSFNMSTIKENEEEIKNVVAEMNTTFSPTGRKCLILDEAHGMSKKAQDSVLVELESLPPQVYVFMCTTELTTLRETLVSRSKATLRLSELSSRECKLLITREITTRHLTFSMAENMILSAIGAWAGNQPRKIINLFESLGENRFVPREEIELFINTTSVSAVIELVKHMYESVILGVDMIQNMEIDISFVNSLVEVCKVALGSNSYMISSNDTIFIKDYFINRDTDKLLQFTIEISSKSRFSKTQVISAFLRAGFNHRVPPISHGKNEIMTHDLQYVDKHIVEKDLLKSISNVVNNNNDLGVKSLNELLSNSHRI